MINNIGETFVHRKCFEISDHVKIVPNIKYDLQPSYNYRKLISLNYCGEALLLAKVPSPCMSCLNVEVRNWSLVTLKYHVPFTLLNQELYVK